MKSKHSLNQRGVALVVSLIFMLLLSLTGIAAMDTTILNGKMAGNARDLNQAFQSAESALRAGEMTVENAASLSALDSTTGYYNLTAGNPDYASAAAWTGSSSIQYGTSLHYVNTPPRYYIKLQAIQDGGSTTSGNIYGYGQGAPGQTEYVFVVTARGTGSTDNATVYLQSNYAKLY